VSQPYVGEIRMFGGNFAPAGWMFCEGQLLAISDFDTLFNLIGTTYGGDGQSTFALPDLRSRVPIHQGNNGTSNYTLAQNGGVENVTLTTNQIPGHTHTAQAQSGPAGQQSLANGFWSAPAGHNLYVGAPGTSAMNGGTIALDGGSQPHDNIMPFLCVSFIISLFGIFPSQT
jgi:microcystin-dependent protein